MSKKRINFLILSSFFIIYGCTHNKKEKFISDIHSIIDTTDAKIGIAIKNLDTNDSLSINNTGQYPMQSVYKFPLAIAVLDRVDKGDFSLDQKMHVSKKDLLPDTWSPLRDKYPNGEIDLSLSEIIDFTVSQSDNNGCDILFRLLGGTEKVEKYIYELGVNDISIKATEEEMHKDWNVQFTNWCKPMAMVQILELFEKKSILSKPSKTFLWESMVQTSTGPNRIKGLLPEGTIVAHKTGTSGKNEDGISAAVNDVGIIVLPNGNKIAIAIFVTSSKVDDRVNESVIAKISRIVYDYYLSGK